MNTGLLDSDLRTIREVLEHYPQVQQAVIFGSRAKGNYRTASDIDIALFGHEVNKIIASAIHGQLEENTPLPYFFDVIGYNDVTNEKLKEHIKRVGIIIYQKKF